jgi:hypothetical protein
MSCEKSPKYYKCLAVPTFGPPGMDNTFLKSQLEQVTLVVETVRTHMICSSICKADAEVFIPPGTLDTTPSPLSQLSICPIEQKTPEARLLPWGGGGG